jgi:maltooligosyltrehalose trehalohydrolase
VIYYNEKRTLGLNFSGEGRSEFLLWAPLAESIDLVVNNSLLLNAVRRKFGYWHLSTDRINPGDLYMVRVNGDKSYPDPASLAQPGDVHGHSQAVELASFEWSDHSWKGLDEENIFYELHTGTFTPEGTFNGIKGKIGYLKELGINTIELMPVAQFPGSRNWGYDGVFPYAVHHLYGGVDGLRYLVNECHKNGIAVFLDVVYNHLGPEGNCLSHFGPYFTDEYKTPWGAAINFDRQWSDGVRHYFIENMLMWFRDFHIDGLRLDAVHAIKDFSARHIISELRENADELEKLTGQKYVLAGEIDLNDTRFIKGYEAGGYNLDKQWCDEFHHAMHSLLTGEQHGYYSDFGELRHLVKSFNSAYVYDGLWSEHRKRTFGSSTTGIPGNKFVVFTQNHDHIGNRMLGDRIGTLLGEDKLRLAAGTMFISPFVPLIFMGEEYNEKNPFLYFTSHTDEALVNAVSKGRRQEFPYFFDSDNFPEPQSEKVFQASVLTFDLAGQNRKVFDYYKELIRLKKDHPIWSSFDRKSIRADESCSNAIVITRKEANHSLTAFLNFGEREVSFPLSLSQRKQSSVLINSASPRWGGSFENPVISRGTDKLIIPGFSMIVISDIP